MRRTYALLLCCISSTAWADDYSLFNPVPDDKMRAMTTERPSKSDSTATLDAGHYEFETSLINYNYNSDCIGGTCTKSHELDFGPTTTLRVGLTQSSEFQVLFDAYRNVTFSDKTNGTSTHASGFGDTTLRYKYNFWGNDGGDTALSGLVFMKLPTNQDNLANNAIEGGVELPFAVTLDNGWSISGMTQFNILDKPAATGEYVDYVNAIVLGKSLTDTTGSYAEFYTSFPDNGDRHWQNTLDFGVTHMLTPSIQVDTGVNLGVSEAATDAQVFAGVAYRF